MKLEDWVGTRPCHLQSVQMIQEKSRSWLWFSLHQKNHPEQPEQAAHTGQLQRDSIYMSKTSNQRAGPGSSPNPNAFHPDFRTLQTKSKPNVEGHQWFVPSDASTPMSNCFPLDTQPRQSQGLWLKNQNWCSRSTWLSWSWSQSLQFQQWTFIHPKRQLKSESLNHHQFPTAHHVLSSEIWKMSTSLLIKTSPTVLAPGLQASWLSHSHKSTQSLIIV